MSTEILFVDTNVFLHYQPLDQIDWLGVTHAKSVLILLPPIIFRELNKQKDVNQSHRLRKRAQAVLIGFGKMFATGLRANLRQGVDAECLVQEPLIDFVTNNLLRDLQDDCLLASILEYKGNNPGTTPKLVTADVGLGLKARARSIPAVLLPDSTKLPDEEGPSEKRIRQLEAENRELKHQMPSLSLCFEDGGAVMRFPKPKAIHFVTEEVERRLAALRLKHPKLNPHQPPPRPRTIIEIVQAQFGRTHPMNLILQERVDQYNVELEQFFTNYRGYLQEWPQHENARLLTVCLEICVVNDGTSPAEDIDVSLHFPDGFQLLDHRHLPQTPAPPGPPRNPNLNESFGNFSALANVPLLRPPSLGPPSNVSSPRIRPSKSYDVDFHVRRLKHGFRESFDPLYVRFFSFEKVFSFDIDYLIHTGNMPKPVEGRLHLVVDGSQSARQEKGPPDSLA